MLVNVNQIDPVGLNLAIQRGSSGAFSGNFIDYVINSGFMGYNVVWATGGAQDISGEKRFLNSPIVPYTGTTGTAPSARFVLDKDLALSGVLTGQLATRAYVIETSGALSGAINNLSGALSVVRVTGSGPISNANLTGLGGAQVIWSGDMIFFSGGAGGGGTDTALSGYVDNFFVNRTSEQAITGNKIFNIFDPGTPPPPGGFQGSTSFNTDAYFSGRAVVVNNPVSGLDAINLWYLSGVSGVLAAAGGGGSPNSVTTTGNEIIGGFKQFTGSPFVPAPTQPSGAANLSWVSGVSGILAARDVTISGALQTLIDAASSTTIVTGAFINSGTITGNFIEGSFFCDPVATGFSLFETHIPHSFYLTGAAFACRTTGYGPVNGGILSGKLYQVDSNNTEQTLLNFTFTSGVIYSGTPTLSVLFSGRNRLGLSLTNSLSGIEKFSVGYFGGSYV